MSLTLVDDFSYTQFFGDLFHQTTGFNEENNDCSHALLILADFVWRSHHTHQNNVGNFLPISEVKPRLRC